MVPTLCTIFSLLVGGLHANHDSLNRRVGAGSAPGIEVLLDGVADSQWTHVLDARGGLTGLDDGTTVEPVDQDIAGAITELHGRTIYHDWLGRPILALDADTGDPIFAVDYDGFGRVAQRRAPWPDNNPTLTKQRIETYFYDGVRRIQEVFADPIAAIPPWPVEVPVGGLGGYVGDLVRTEAEYIWSAASGQPFDTCHVQIDWWDREAWFVQDHQTGTVRAYTDANGEMVRQYRFDAFGNLLNLDTFPLASGSGLFANFRNRLGHQGLFAERVDASTTATTLSPNPNAQVWYQSRSRWYVPELGRFMTSDPNATGVPTMTALAMLGTTPTGPPSGSFDWASHYGDGWDTWTAYGANPVMGQDPSGLFFGLLGTMSGTGIGTFYNGTVFESGANIFFGLDSLAAGISLQQVQMEMLANAAIGLSLPVAGKALSEFGSIGKAIGSGTFRRGAYLGAELYPEVGRILPYRQAQKLTRGFSGEIQAHHIVEKRVAKALGIPDLDGMPAVILTREQHQMITNELRNAIPYGIRKITSDEARLAYMKAYRDFPELLSIAMRIIP